MDHNIKKMGNKLGVVADLQIWNGKLDLLMSIGLLHQVLPNVTTFIFMNKISSHFFSLQLKKFITKILFTHSDELEHKRGD